MLPILRGNALLQTRLPVREDSPKPMEVRNRLLVAKSMSPILLLLLFLFRSPVMADSTFLYAVQLSASIRISPPQITLRWPQDQYGADTYVVYRKSKSDTAWGPGTTLPGSVTTLTDSSVSGRCGL